MPKSNEKSNEEFLTKYVDRDVFPTYADLQEIFEKFKDYHCEKDHVPGVEWIKLSQELGKKMIMDEEIYTHFGEVYMLKLIKASIQPLFDEKNHKEEDAPLFGHTFAPFQNILSRSAKLGYTSIYKYMTDNILPMKYDIDCMDLHLAIKYQHEDILDIIIATTDETYGTKGSFTHRIRRETKGLEELHTLSNEMKIKLSEHFEWLDIDTISSENSLDAMKAKWELKTDDELKDLIRTSKGINTDEERDAIKHIYKARLEKQLEILERQIKLKEMKS